jgi:DNA-binding GntR family transcriptional regulator
MRVEGLCHRQSFRAVAPIPDEWGPCPDRPPCQDFRQPLIKPGTHGQITKAVTQYHLSFRGFADKNMKFKRMTYHVQVADMLRDMVMTGKLKEGDKINETQLCDTMGVSKTPLREALRVLSVEGLIQLIPNRGAFVTRPTSDEIAEMFDVMSLLESFCARTASEKMTPKSFARLEKLHGKLEESFERRNQEEYIRINNQYHSLVQEIAGNLTLNQIVDGLRKKYCSIVSSP